MGNISAPWDFGGHGSQGLVLNTTFIASGMCGSRGLTLISDAAACQAAAAEYFGAAAFTWGGVISADWNYPAGCIVMGTTV